MVVILVLLSIIIPHYNSTGSLAVLLDSIPNIEEIEIIVVDDKSDVQKIELLKNNKKYGHVHFLRNDKEKRSAGTCRNLGIEYAKGRWILFADSDDYFIEGFYNIIKKYFLSEYEVVFFTPVSIEKDTNEVSNRHQHFQQIIDNYIKYQDYKSELYLRYSFDVPWSKLISKKFIIQNDIDFDEVIASNDVMFSAKVGYYMNSYKASKEVIYCVTRNSGSLTTNISEEIFDSRLKVYIDYRDFLKTRITKRQFKLLNINGLIMVIKAINYKLGYSKVISVALTLIKNRFLLFDRRFVNPFFVVKKVISLFKENTTMQKYYFK
ncbi:glycosyltransferase family 2 protein [Virgibacillus dokdonensis]|uniref:glycosyltransferase family 2 protein n=1 Tax=Virgibacillus dokdonensis TaxID=302167 RepID=UPI000989EFB9|nr:glycosyltransferase [Virgibacillus dokdonensis]